MKNKEISISFMTEKKVGHGEDAPPLLVVKGNTYAVGVFDGMGGAGATTCNSSFGDGFTQAYVSSRIVCSSMNNFLHNHLSTDDVSEEDMKAVITNKLREEKENFPPKTKSSLRSKLVREYPTTMAVVTLTEQRHSLSIDSYWAGDSHCYLWTKKGFYQISKDDFEEDMDPFENLHNDAAISNCVCADRDFQINHKHINLSEEPVAILCATDGCFGYFQTPMHFEDLLKRCLRKSRNEKEWQDLVCHNIQKVTGDDTSLSLVGVGFSSFDQFKNMMTCQSVLAIKGLRNLEEEIAKLKRGLQQASLKYEKAVQSGWESYKQNYMKYLNEKENAN